MDTFINFIPWSKALCSLNWLFSLRLPILHEIKILFSFQWIWVPYQIFSKKNSSKLFWKTESSFWVKFLKSCRKMKLRIKRAVVLKIHLAKFKLKFFWKKICQKIFWKLGLIMIWKFVSKKITEIKFYSQTSEMVYFMFKRLKMLKVKLMLIFSFNIKTLWPKIFFIEIINVFFAMKIYKIDYDE